MSVENDDVRIPVPSMSFEMDDSYAEYISVLKREVSSVRMRAVMHANEEMTKLYWKIGKSLIEAQRLYSWGSKVVDRISSDLKRAFPDMKGFSPTNLKYMRRFAEAWDEEQIGQQAVAQLPWGSHIVLLTKLDSTEDRRWYANQALENGWSRNILALQIESALRERTGLSVSNFNQALPPVDSDMAEGIFKDPYLFDFLGTADIRREREVEKGLTQHIQEFLLELGQGFAFVGRQVHLEVGGDDFYLDLLFYHLVLRRYVVIELKARPFEPGFVSQLYMYQAVVDDLLRHEGDEPTIGLLLVRGKNEVVARYSLAGYSRPIGVADWTQRLEESIPDDLKSELPSVEDIERELNRGI